MRVLDFKVNKQTISKHGDFSGLIAGTRGYLRARFAFSSEWANSKRVAVFSCADGEFPVLLKGNMCDVPDEAAACLSFKVRVVGRHDNDTMTSSRVTVIQRRY